MRLLSRVLAVGGLAVTLALCAFVDPSKVGPVGALSPSELSGGGDTGLRLVARATEYELSIDGTAFTLESSSSGATFDHLMAGFYRYVPSVAALAAGQDTVAWTKFDYFDGVDTDHYASKFISTVRLSHGDSLVVRTQIAVATDSTSILDTRDVAYLIHHPVWQGGAAFCLVISADDGYPTNLAWSTAADSMGFTYTLSPSLEDTLGIADPAMLSAANLAVVASRGVEIGYTGNHHRSSGVLAFTKAAGVTEKIAAYYDPTVIEAIAGSPVLTQAIDLHNFSWKAAAVLDSLGYTNARGGYWDGTESVRGYNSSANGNSAWDLGRPLNWYEPVTLFGYSSWEGEDGTNPTSAIFDTGAGATLRDSISDRLDRDLNESARNGFAPISYVIHGSSVTREDVENLVLECRERGIWIASHGEMIEWYKSHHAPRDAAPWMAYGQCRNIVAADSMIWGPALPSFTDGEIAAAESYIFSNTTTHVNVATYDHSYTDGLTKGTVTYGTAAVQDSAYHGTQGRVTYSGNLPLNGTESFAWLAFNVDELDAIDPDRVISATLSWVIDIGSNNQDITGGTNEDNRYNVIGVTNPVLFEGFDQNDTSYHWSDVSDQTEWSVPLSTFDSEDDFGEFCYSKYVYANATTTFSGQTGDNGWTDQDVTEYVRAVIESNLPSAAFIFTGRCTTRYTVIYPHTNTFASLRPHLVVQVAP